MRLEFNFKQSGVVPYRKNNGKLEILLITSIKKKKWIIPKGYIEFNLTPFESAKKEAFEEAGIIGSNETFELGTIELKKGMGVTHMKIFSMEIIKILEDYPDKEMRKRKWFSTEEASAKVSIPEIPGMIASLQTKVR
ncbi:MAG TPA: NUDIX domain-containing protein [Ignavibacteriaceae bacterium]|nr:NUDIX domain-containing protein [Ignavibacteriaceae bacterium]